MCIEGTEADGHDFAAEAAERGAAAVICQKPLAFDSDTAVILTDDSRRLMAHVSAAFYGFPARELALIAVTGTKGKTTTTFMIQSMFKKAGRRCGLMGTVHIDTGRRLIQSSHTTPESVEIHRYLREMADSGCEAAVIEVSSQAMKLQRAEGICFDYGVFTNIEEDHIGKNEHRDFQEYAACKAKLFAACRRGIVNGDDPLLPAVLEGSSCEIETYGFGAGADLCGKNAVFVRMPGKLGVEFQIRGDYNIDLVTGIPGRFSCYNSMAAVAVCRHFGIDGQFMKAALMEIAVPGRQEMFSAGPGGIVMVDYAHNGTALRNLLRSLRDYNPERLTCIFGCGGQRDPGRRIQMARAAADYADFIVVTTDNPRGENPDEIINDIVSQLVKYDKEFVVISDRREAIRYSAEHCIRGEIAVVAGKGHEDYQIIGDKKIHFDDREEVLAATEKVNYESNDTGRN